MYYDWLPPNPAVYHQPYSEMAISRHYAKKYPHIISSWLCTLHIRWHIPFYPQNLISTSTYLALSVFHFPTFGDRYNLRLEDIVVYNQHQPTRIGLSSAFHRNSSSISPRSPCFPSTPAAQRG